MTEEKVSAIMGLVGKRVICVVNRSLDNPSVVALMAEKEPDMTEDDTEDLQAERRAARQKMLALLAHPDVRDPDYPDEGEDE